MRLLFRVDVVKWGFGPAGAGLLAVLAIGTAAAEIGGPPTADFQHCDRLLRPCGQPVVIGEGRTFAGPVEIVAFTSSAGLCIEIDVVRISGTGHCPGPIHPRVGNAISSSGTGVSFGKPRYTEVVGAVVPGTATVRVNYRRNGQTKQAAGIVAQVDGELQQRLQEPAPFGVFYAMVRGCVAAKRIRLAALDASGTVLGRTRVPNLLPAGFEECDRTPEFPIEPPQPRAHRALRGG
jgi:hypothetical protein